MTTRRTLLQAALLAGLPTTVAALSARAQSAAQSTAMSLTPTPACGEGHGAATPPQTEGPYFRPNSPARRSLLDPELPGTRLRVGGLVLSRACRPLPEVLVDLWHADAQGDYDNAGYRLRGHQFTDADGRWQFETIVPAVYPGRTPSPACEAAAAPWPGPYHAALFPRRSRQCARSDFRQAPAARAGWRCDGADRAVRLRTRYRLSEIDAVTIAILILSAVRAIVAA